MSLLKRTPSPASASIALWRRRDESCFVLFCSSFDEGMLWGSDESGDITAVVLSQPHPTTSASSSSRCEMNPCAENSSDRSFSRGMRLKIRYEIACCPTLYFPSMTFWKNIMLEETYFKVNRLYCDAPRIWISQQPLCLKTYRLGISFYRHGLLSEAPLLSLNKSFLSDF